MHFWNLLCLCHVCDEEELQLIFLEDSGTLEYSTCILLQRLCVQCSLKIHFCILCTCVWCTGTSRVTSTHNILYNPMENGFLCKDSQCYGTYILNYTLV
jgi:hypothetical protein